MSRLTNAECRVATLLGMVLLAAFGQPAPAVAAPAGDSPNRDEVDVRRAIADYGRAIQEHDLALFKKVKPNLNKDEEERLRRAFETVKSQIVNITILEIQVDGAHSVAHLSRRDTIAGSLVSSFPQTLSLQKGTDGWFIEQIGR
jgi:hypothetical protein